MMRKNISTVLKSIIVAFLFFFVTLANGAQDKERVLFSDNFSNELENWIVWSGRTWKVEDGVCVAGRGEHGVLLSGVGEHWSNYTFEVRMKTDEPGVDPEGKPVVWKVAAMLFRYKSEDDRYQVLLLTDGRINLEKVEKGVKKFLRTVKTEKNLLEWNKFRVELKGENIKVYINDKLYIDYIDAGTLLKTGRVGLWNLGTRSCRFDDVKVWGRDITPKRRRVEKPVIGIFKDKVPIVESKPSDPDYLAGILNKAGFRTKFLKAEELADPTILNTDNVETLVLPYGSSFPYEAIGNLKRYLKAGGNFFSTGGYTFDTIYSIGDKKIKNIITHIGFESEEELRKTDAFYEGVVPVPKGVTIKRDDEVKYCENFSLRFEVPPVVPMGWFGPVWRFEIGDEIKTGDRLRITGFIKTKDVRGISVPRPRGGAYIATNYYQKSGERIKWDQSKLLRGTNDWCRVSFLVRIPPDTSYMTLNLLLYGHGIAWFDEVKVEKVTPFLNTRDGVDSADYLKIEPDQIPIFDAGYKLENAVLIKSNPVQFVIDKNVLLRGKFKGYAATVVTASGLENPALFKVCRRWIPLLRSYDRYNRLRGTAGALVYNYGGTYKNSAWAYFGVNNSDLFKPDNKQMAAVFIDVINHMRRKTFLHDLSSNYASYRQGEEVTMSVKSSNYGYEKQEIHVKMQVTDHEGKKVYFEETQMAELNPGDTKDFRFVWKPERFERDFYRFCAILYAGNKPMDIMESGFCIWNEEILQSGLKLTWDNSYFYVNGKPFFFIGTNYVGAVFHSDAENPLVLMHDLRKMQDHGITGFRVLHFGMKHPYLFPDFPKPTEKTFRRLDALVQLCQKHNIVLLQTTHDWMPTIELTDKDLEGQKEFAGMLSARYKNITGLRWDIQNEPRPQESAEWGRIPDINREYNAYLKERYGTTNRLKEAWGEKWVTAELGLLSFDPGTGDSWDDVKAYDLRQFRRRLFNRWINANYEGLKETSKYNVTVSGASPEDNILFDNVECMAIHCYTVTPEVFKYIDQRFRVPFGLGEFGRKVHPAWPRAWEDEIKPTTFDEAVKDFLAAGHYLLGLGGYGIYNWCWKDPEGSIFPWGINFPCDLVSKPILPAYRNMSLFFRSFSPKYTPPELYLLIPVSHEMSRMRKKVTDGTFRAIRFLIDSHVDFGVIDEFSLEKGKLPKTAKFIVYPIPFVLPDTVYKKLKEFVSNGGTLYISGDISYDTFFKRTRTERLKELCGVKFQSENYPNIDYMKGTKRLFVSREGIPEHEGYPCIRVKPITAKVLAEADGEPVIFENKLGKGKVFYTTDLYELNSLNDNRLYKAFLSRAGVSRNKIKPDDPKIHIFKLATIKDEIVYILFNTDTEKEFREVTFNLKDKPITMTLGKQRPGAVIITKDGKIRGMESQGKVKVGGEIIADLQANAMVFTLDNEDIRSSDAIVVLPIQSGEISLRVKPDLEMDIGEMRDGKWTVYEIVSKLHQHKNGYKFTIADDQTDCIFLLTPKQEKEKYRKIFENFVTLKHLKE